MSGRLVLVTQVVDADHPNLGVTVDLVRALASRFDELAVVTDRVGRHDLPGNVRFRTFGSHTRAARAVRFEAALAREVARRPTALLAHMVPLYALLAAPPAVALRVPILLWYTHWKADRSLRAALRVSRLVLTVDQASFPLASGKVRAIGHAVDTGRFRQRDAPPQDDGRLRLLALGKTEPWKGLHLVLDAVERARERGVDAELEIRGPQLTERQRAHRAALEERIRASSVLAGSVWLAPPVPRSQVPALLHDADAVVTASAPVDGAEALDKVVYEAAAATVPVLACNPSLESVLAPHGLFFPAGDAAALADRLVTLATVDVKGRHAIGLELREWVERSHSLDRWADAVAAAAREARGR